MDLVVLAAWDDLVDHSHQADVEDSEEDLACARPVVLEVLDQAWDGSVDEVAAVCQRFEVNSSDPTTSTSMGIGLIAGASENE